MAPKIRSDRVMIIVTNKCSKYGKKMAIKQFSIFLMISMLIFSTGCWDKIEIDDRAFVLGIVIDSQGPGNPDKIRTIFYAPIPSKLAGGEVDAYTVVESQGDNMPTAIENLNMQFSRQLFFGQTKVLLIGESALKDGEILRKLMDFIERDPDMGREMLVAVVKGEAKALAHVKPKFEKVFASYMSGIFNNSARVSSILSLSINELLLKLRENKGSAVIPVAEVVGDQVKVRQLALIKDYKLVSYLDNQYLRPFSIFTDKLKDGQIEIPYMNNNVTLNITSSNRRLHLKSFGGNLEYNMQVRLECDVDNYVFQEDLFEKNRINDIKDKLSSKIKAGLNKTLDYFQNEAGYDYLGIGEYTKKFHYNVFKQYEANWEDEFKKVKINYDVQIFIRRIGAVKK